jgi:hypothetical protein
MVACRRDLSRFSRLESLDLAGNSIEHITGLGALKSLESLNLQDNSIRSCRGLEGCKRLLRLGELLRPPCLRARPPQQVAFGAPAQAARVALRDLPAGQVRSPNDK